MEKSFFPIISFAANLVLFIIYMLEISKAFQKLDIKRRKTQYGFDQAPRASSGDLAANNQFITYLQIFCIKLLSKNIVTVTI